ncbi:MAG: hypothetical protein K6B40_04020 [Firmicutes bacterium]|nr:hypothetical protein [Bacillota bacterium]
MKEKPDIIHFVAAPGSQPSFFPPKPRQYDLPAGNKRLKVTEIACPLRPKALAGLYQTVQQQRIPILALPLSAAALCPPEGLRCFVADGRLLALAWAAEAWRSRYGSAGDMLPAVDISLAEGRLLARLAPSFLHRFCLWGGAPEQIAATARQIYRESGLVVRAGRGDILLRPAGAAFRPGWQPTAADFVLPAPQAAMEAGVCDGPLAEAALFCALKRRPRDPYLLIQALRRQACRCKYYGPYFPSK